MSRTRTVLAVMVGTIVLLVWYGLAQLFPWGTKSVGNFSATSSETYVSAAPGLEEAPPGTWTTEAFEDRLGGRISTLATDRSFSWIIAAPREHHSFPRYLAFHALTQAGVAAFSSSCFGCSRRSPGRAVLQRSSSWVWPGRSPPTAAC